VKDKILDIYDSHIKGLVSAPLVPFALGVLNLVFAESLAGVTLGVLLILVAGSDYMEQNGK
jgi:hypothetical protein